MVESWLVSSRLDIQSHTFLLSQYPFLYHLPSDISLQFLEEQACLDAFKDAQDGTHHEHVGCG